MKLNNFPASFKLGSTRDFKPAGSILWNLFGSQVPSDLILLEDAQSIQIQKVGSLAVCCFNFPVHLFIVLLLVMLFDRYSNISYASVLHWLHTNYIQIL
jgi:hypothetical protein